MSVPIHALNGLDLRRAVATALGYRKVVLDDAPNAAYLLHPNARRSAVVHERDVWVYAPHFEESLDACFAPGGPVERLRADSWAVKIFSVINGRWYASLTGDFENSHRSLGHDGATPAEALSRAFLKAVEPASSGIPCDGSQE